MAPIFGSTYVPAYLGLTLVGLFHDATGASVAPLPRDWLERPKMSDAPRVCSRQNTVRRTEEDKL